ncbi:MAG: helix-turn-helix domain-containing protein [Fimbriimonadaceae bacterium]|nr:helix-turn-helix domain-containing protein [Fimbriimonadaceae bacterium]
MDISKNSVAQIGKAIRKRRKDLRITQVQLARMTKVNAATIGALENGKENLRVGIVVTVCDVLGLRIVLE